MIPSFEDAFRAEILKISGDSSLADHLWSEIEKNYSKSSRHYHTLTHLENMHRQLYAVKNQISDWTVLILSIAYHDIIYSVVRSDNELKSASFALKRIVPLNLTPEQFSQCGSQICATQRHLLSDDGDTNFLMDADLAILGTTESDYQQYTEQIRKEYRRFPDLIYRPGRVKVLRHFLEMEEIYKTAYFRNEFEQQARINMRNEIKELQK